MPKVFQPLVRKFKVHHDPEEIDQKELVMKMPFKPRSGCIDWKVIQSVDIESIIETSDIDTLQMLLPNLVYADVTLSDASNPTEISDEYFVKLFQTAQMTAEYLIAVQEQKVSQVKVLEEECGEIQRSCDELERSYLQQEEDIEKITKEMEEKRNQIQALEMKLLTPGKHVEFPITKPSVCAVCKKSFLNEFFLQQHQTRKHEDDDKVVVKESIQVVITQHDTGRMMKIEKLLTSSMNMLYKDVAFSASLPMEMIRLLYNSKYIAQKDDSSILQLMGCTSATQVQNEVLRISLQVLDTPPKSMQETAVVENHDALVEQLVQEKLAAENARKKHAEEIQQLSASFAQQIADLQATLLHEMKSHSDQKISTTETTETSPFIAVSPVAKQSNKPSFAGDIIDDDEVGMSKLTKQMMEAEFEIKLAEERAKWELAERKKRQKKEKKNKLGTKNQFGVSTLAQLMQNQIQEGSTLDYGITVDNLSPLVNNLALNDRATNSYSNARKTDMVQPVKTKLQENNFVSTKLAQTPPATMQRDATPVQHITKLEKPVSNKALEASLLGYLTRKRQWVLHVPAKKDHYIAASILVTPTTTCKVVCKRLSKRLRLQSSQTVVVLDTTFNERLEDNVNVFKLRDRLQILVENIPSPKDMAKTIASENDNAHYATRIQSVYRGKLDRNRTAILRRSTKQKERVNRTKAAIQLQNFIRAYLAKQYYRELLAQQKAKLQLEEEAKAQLDKKNKAKFDIERRAKEQARVKLEKKEKILKADTESKVDEIEMLIHQTLHAVKIQAAYRGMAGRQYLSRHKIATEAMQTLQNSNILSTTERIVPSTSTDIKNHVQQKLNEKTATFDDTAMTNDRLAIELAELQQRQRNLPLNVQLKINSYSENVDTIITELFEPELSADLTENDARQAITALKARSTTSNDAPRLEANETPKLEITSEPKLDSDSEEEMKLERREYEHLRQSQIENSVHEMIEDLSDDDESDDY